MKAYSTRVGSGPYPTELHDGIGAGIAERGREFGTVTGRPRRVGWFDAVPLRYAVAVNSVSSIMLNKLDILSGVDPIRICVAYEIDGRRVETWPSSGAALARATPIYEDFPGWAEPIHDVRSLRRPARERAPLRVAPSRRTPGVPDRPRVGRAGADPDDRARLAPDAPPTGAPGMSGQPRDADPDPHRRRGRPGARPGLEAGGGAGRQRGHRRAGQPRRSPPSRASVAWPTSTRWIRRAVVAAARRSGGRARRHRARGAAGGRRRRRARGGGHRGLRAVGRRGPDRVEQGVLSRGRGRGGRADGAGRVVRGRRPSRRRGVRPGPRRRWTGRRRQGGRAGGRQGRDGLRRSLEAP